MKERDDFKVNIRYKVLTVLLLICLFLLLSGCGDKVTGSTSNDTHTIKIGISIYDGYDTLISGMVSDMTKWAREKERETGDTIMLDVVSAGGSQLTQNDQVAKFADKNYDVICVNLVDRTDATVIIDKARNASVPVVFFNRELVPEDLSRWDKLYYVGADAEQSGKLQAKLVTNALFDRKRYASIDKNGDGVIQYVILEGETGHQDALVRTQVCIEQIQRSGFKIEKIGDEIANWNRTQATSKMNMLLENHPMQIEMVIANDDDMALGALDAINAKDETLPLIVGINGTSEALEMVKNKKMEGTVYNDVLLQSSYIMTIAYSLAVTGEIPEGIKLTDENSVYVDYQLIDYDNVQEYIRKRE